jgi:bifunctional UDP-N-acetylglucosamine pyrophosphorylase/glucosamine-1-phosphate N-acetyltransferase
MTSPSPAPLHVVILAAGKGTRMKTTRPKLLHRLAGLPLVHYPIRAARALRPDTITIVLGYQADEVRAALAGEPGLCFAVQEPQLGTGHAVLQAEGALRGRRGTLVLLYGDVPLIRPESLRRLVAHHEATAASATVVTAVIDRPQAYGRILRDAGGAITAIVEERDATDEQRAVREINSGIWAFALDGLFDLLRRLGSDNDQGEYYLTDLVQACRRQGLGVETVVLEDATEIRGINSQAELAAMGAIVRRGRNEALMAAGVTLVDPATTYIDADVEVGPDTLVHPNVHLEGRTRIGSACEIHSGVRIVDSTVGDGTVIRNHCVLEDSTIAGHVDLGPFARLRPGSDVRARAHIGNFVELKKTVFGEGSKAGHLTYLGDATIGAGVNIGAGTITCNYDGVRKNPTVIEDGVFVGSDSQLVAPVTVGQGAYVAAGSTVTDDVPAGALAIARGRQVNKEGWVERKKGQ